MRLERMRVFAAAFTAVAALAAIGAAPALAQRDAVLILAPTVSGGTNSLEAQLARNAGMEVDVVDGPTWLGMSEAQFDDYRAIVLGDPRFAFPGNYQPAAENAATWGAIVDGNVVVIGTDPVDHQFSGGRTLVEKGIAYAIDDADRTGLYVSLSDAYDGTAPGTALPMLYGLPGGDEFRIAGAGCYEDAHIIAEHPVIDQLTDAILSNWGCSVHNTFTAYPEGFIPLAIAEGQGDYVAPDGTVGFPYILVRGRTTTLAGRSIVAIGDSVSAGEGIAEGWAWHPEGPSDGQWEQDGPSVPWDTTFTVEFCHQTPQAHPRVLAAKTSALITHLSCTGSRADNGVLAERIDDGEFKAPAQLSPAFGNPFDAALPDIVTISLGANDISFADVVADCITPHPDVSAGWDGWLPELHIGDGDCEYSAEEMNERFAFQQQGLRDVLDDIRARGEAAGKVPVVALTQYADPFPHEWTDSCPDLDIPLGGVTLSRDEVEFMRDGLHSLNEGIAAVAADYENALVVAPPPVYGEHRFCTENPWTYGPSLVFDKGLQGFHEGWEIGISKTPFHPTPEGQEAIADALFGPVVNKVLVRAGTDVGVRTPDGPRARFAVVTTQGGFTANPLAPGAAPVPSAFLMRQAWDLAAAAIFTGPVTVSLPAQPGDSVWHYTGGRWVELPTTYANGYASAQVDHLSPFAVGPRVPEVHAGIAPVEGGRAPHDVAFDATGSSVEGGGGIASYEWDFGDGGTATGASPSHRFAQSGTYEVTVRVTSGAGAVDEATTTLTVTNPAPVAAIAGPARVTAGEPAAYSAAGSTDNGRITEIAWYFGDGTENVIGAEPTHTFAAPGTYTIGVVVTDDEGKAAMKILEVEVVPPGPRYAFEGFLAPVDNLPTVNAVNAGRAVPVKFRLGGDHGLDVFDDGYPQVHRVDCASGAALDEIESTVTAGASGLQYDAASETYTYVWKTDAAWAGSCRRLVLGLDDGSRHTASFKLR
jgi:PKD repeat protein/lysophospholipase L1-like esterase